MRKRVFVGVEVDKRLQKKIAIWQKENLGKLPLRIIQPKNLHITLVPPWYEEELSQVRAKLNAVESRISPFEISFYKVEFGPSRSRPRLVWAVGKQSRGLNQLKRLVEEILDKKAEKREFLPHLTLSRFKQKDYSRLPIKRFEKKVDWKMKIESVALFESHLSSSGADYRKLCRCYFR